MTIAIALATYEGVVFGCDSAAAVGDASSNPPGQVVQIFNAAQKIFEIGPANQQFIAGSSFSGMFMTDGNGFFGPFSWRDIVNKFYVESAQDLKYGDDVAQCFSDFATREWARLKTLNLVSATASLPHSKIMLAIIPKGSTEIVAATVECSDGSNKHPITHMVSPGWAFGGLSETVGRLIDGYDPRIKKHLIANGVAESLIDAAAESCDERPLTKFIPLRDAIGMVHWLVYSTIQAHRFKDAGPLVAGDIEIATLTTDRGFRWAIHKSLTSGIIPRSMG